MKIKINTNPTGIFTLHGILQSMEQVKPNNKGQKVLRCVLLDVADKIATKERDLRRKMGLFDGKKKIDVTLKYSQAYYLNQLLNGYICEGDLENAAIYHINSQLGSKL